MTNKAIPKLEPYPAPTKWCPIHQTNMRRRRGNGRTWYSHLIPGRGWCNGERFTGKDRR